MHRYTDNKAEQLNSACYLAFFEASLLPFCLHMLRTQGAKMSGAGLSPLLRCHRLIIQKYPFHLPKIYHLHKFIATYGIRSIGSIPGCWAKVREVFWRTYWSNFFAISCLSILPINRYKKTC
jgi:hypothetical protein